jgi:biopolymer transport protein ExbD
MPFHRSIRMRRKRKRVNQGFELQLTSMMDILVIILVFLLKSYSVSMNSFSTVPGLKLPISASLDIPPDSLYVIITPEGLTFEGQRIVEFTQTADAAGGTEGTYSFRSGDLDEGGRRIVALGDALRIARDKAEVLRAKSPARDEQGKPLEFEGILAIQADKRVQYDTIRKIMYTAAAAGFRTFRFLALKRES